MYPVTQQYYLHARFYNPVIGRFTQEDTYYGDGLNLYQYCQANPVGYVDPSGHNICPTQLSLYKKYKEFFAKKMPEAEAKKKAYEYMRKKMGLTADNPFTEASEGGTKSAYNDRGVGKSKNPWKSYKNDKETKTLYHYTNKKGMKGIVDSKKLNPSLKANNPKDARYGNGQYLSDIKPESYSPAQLAKKFINLPNKYKYTYYIEIDVTNLEIIQGRDGVFVIQNEAPLDLTGRIVRTGVVGKN